MFSAALLFCDENPCKYEIRSQSGTSEKTGVLQFGLPSLHAAQTPVEFCVARFGKRSVDQQQVARHCLFSKLHEAEIVARTAFQSLPAYGSEAGALPTPSLPSPVPLLASPHTAVFDASSSMLRFVPLSPATQTSGVMSSASASITAAKLFSNPAFLQFAMPIRMPVISQPQKSAESSKASKYKLEEAKWTGNVVSEAR